MDRATKLTVLASNLVAVLLFARLGSGGLGSILAPAAVAFALSFLCALVAGDIAVTIVLSLVYFVPALCFASFKTFFFSHYAIWLAALCGAILPRSVRSPWALPAEWRPPVVLWALVLALSWPLILVREVDFVPALRDAVYLSNSRLGVSPPTVFVWTLSVASISITGLLLLDWLFLAYPDDDRKRFESHIIWPLFGGASIAAAVGAYQGLADMAVLNPTLFLSLGRAVGTMHDANAFGSVAAMWVPVAVAAAIGRHGGSRRMAIVWIVPFAVLGIGVWASGSRTALFAAITGVVVLVACVFRTLNVRQTLIGAAGLAVLVLMIVFLVPGSTGPWKRIQAFAQLMEARGYPMSTRAGMAYSAGQLWAREGYGTAAHWMIAEHPFVGVGVGGFYYQYADALYLLNRSINGSVIPPDNAQNVIPPDNAQNWFRHQLAEFGLLGSAGWMAWTGMVLWMLVRRHGPDDRRAMVGAAKGAVIGLGVASLVGMPTQDTAASISFVVFAGWCLKLTGVERPPVNQNRARWNLEWAAILVILFTFLGGTAYAAWTDLRPPHRALRADFPYQYGFSAPDKDEPQFRWTGAKAVDVFHSDKRWLVLVIGAVAPDAAEHPVRVRVWFNDQLILRVDRRSNFPITKYIKMPAYGTPIMIQIQTSRTWRPVDFGLGDDRQERGVAVGNWVFRDEDPPKASLTVE
jgi:hypothetical protein